ncbi:MAG: hypothetical protein QW212_00650 [Nitrososphaerales archaeon]
MEWLKEVFDILGQPEGPSYQELQVQAKAYLKSLTPEQYAALRQEALDGNRTQKADEYADKLELFRRILFTPIEARAYAAMRLNSPGVRRVIARRALLGILKGWKELPPGIVYTDLVHMEDELLGQLSDEDIMEGLRFYRQKLKL